MPESCISNDTMIEVQYEGFYSTLDILMYYVAVSNNTGPVGINCKHVVRIHSKWYNFWLETKSLFLPCIDRYWCVHQVPIRHGINMLQRDLCWMLLDIRLKLSSKHTDQVWPTCTPRSQLMYFLQSYCPLIKISLPDFSWSKLGGKLSCEHLHIKFDICYFLQLLPFVNKSCNLTRIAWLLSD